MDWLRDPLRHGRGAGPVARGNEMLRGQERGAAARDKQAYKGRHLEHDLEGRRRSAGTLTQRRGPVAVALIDEPLPGARHGEQAHRPVSPARSIRFWWMLTTADTAAAKGKAARYRGAAIAVPHQSNQPILISGSDHRSCARPPKICDLSPAPADDRCAGAAPLRGDRGAESEVSSACGQPLPLPCCSRALWQVLSLNNSREPLDARTSALAVLQRN